jgi:hypothetical protein
LVHVRGEWAAVAAVQLCDGLGGLCAGSGGDWAVHFGGDAVVRVVQKSLGGSVEIQRILWCGRERGRVSFSGDSVAFKRIIVCCMLVRALQSCPSENFVEVSLIIMLHNYSSYHFASPVLVRDG